MNVKDMEDMVKNYNSKETEASADQLDFGLKIVIDPVVYQKVMYWVHKSPYEVSGLGNVVFEPDTNTIRVIDAIMLPQKNTGTTTDIEAADVAKAMFRLRNAPGQLRWWWHSHVNMNVFWSGTDISTIQTLGNGGWISATVFNKRNETKSAFCQKTPVRLLVTDVPTQVSVNKDLSAQWDAEYDKNVENVQHSFRSRFGDDEEDEEIKQAFQKATQEDETVIAEDPEWETVTNGRYTFKRKKNNLVPVQRKSLDERKTERLTGINEKTGQLELPDLASDDELAKWEHSTSDDDELDMAVDEFMKNRND
jgi:hypothetical protein